METPPSNFIHTGNEPQWQRENLPQSIRLENYFPTKWSSKQAGVAILILDKIDFQPKVIKKDLEGYFIFIIENSTKKNSLSWTSMLQMKGHIHS